MEVFSVEFRCACNFMKPNGSDSVKSNGCDLADVGAQTGVGGVQSTNKCRVWGKFATKLEPRAKK